MRGRQSMTVAVDAATVRSWAGHCSDRLAAHRAELDALNVFPVADSDTGTNLYLTFADARTAAGAEASTSAAAQASVSAAADATDRGAPEAPVDVARRFARGALIGARGSSGVIVGQYMGALVRELVRPGPGLEIGAVLDVTPARVVAALRTAEEAAFRSVADPVEGTVLTVARAVADGARTAATVPGRPTSALAALEAGIGAGYRALGQTTHQLAPLRQAGVLDAGAWGLLLVLDALAEALGSRDAADRSRTSRSPDVAPSSDPPARPTREEVTRGTGRDEVGQDGHDHGGGEFEVMYLVDADGGQDMAAELRPLLSQVGEAVAVVGGDGLWQAHVHTDRPLAALEAAVTIGLEPSQIRIRHLAIQSGVHSTHRPALGLVAITRAPGLVLDLARAGAVVVLVPPQGAVGPELGRAVDDTGAQRVLVLASMPLASVGRRPTAHPGSEPHLAPDQPPASEPDAPDARVLVLEGLGEVRVVCGAATLASLDPSTPPAELEDAVTAAIGTVRTATLVLDGVGGLEQADRMLTAATDLLRAGGALLTVVTAERTPAEVLVALREGIAHARPGVEVVVLDGATTGVGTELGVE